MIADSHRVFPEEHFPVFVQLISELVRKILMLPLQPIENTQAIKIKSVLDESIGTSLSAKVLREMVNAAANNDNVIKKPRLSTLNLLAKFVMGKFAEGNSTQEALDRHDYWYEYLDLNKHLIILTTENEFSDNKESFNESNKISKAKDFDNPTNDPQLESSVESENASTDQVDFGKIRKGQFQGCLIGGFLVGILNALLVILFPHWLSGYSNVSNEEFIAIIPGIASANIAAGILFGLVCGYFGRHPYPNVITSKVTRKEKVWIAVLSFLILVPFKQAASRSAGQMPTPMGFPDFETVSYYLTCTIGIICLLRILRANYVMDFNKRIKQALLVTFNIAIPLIIIYFIFHFAIEKSDLNGKIYAHEGLALFKIQYSHPERIFLILTMSFFSVFILITSRNYYLRSIE